VGSVSVFTGTMVWDALAYGEGGDGGERRREDGAPEDIFVAKASG
jgi:hypothetical protein